MSRFTSFDQAQKIFELAGWELLKHYGSPRYSACPIEQDEESMEYHACDTLDEVMWVWENIVTKKSAKST